MCGLGIPLMDTVLLANFDLLGRQKLLYCFFFNLAIHNSDQSRVSLHGYDSDILANTVGKHAIFLSRTFYLSINKYM